MREQEAGVGGICIAVTGNVQAGLGAFIDLEKADFIGKTALLEADPWTLLYGIKCLSNTPYRNAEIIKGGTCVGRVTASGWSPYPETGIGYVRFDKAGDWAGKSLFMKTRQGELAGCEIVTLPFYDAEKRIPRGLGQLPPDLKKQSPPPGRKR